MQYGETTRRLMRGSRTDCDAGEEGLKKDLAVRPEVEQTEGHMRIVRLGGLLSHGPHTALPVDHSTVGRDRFKHAERRRPSSKKCRWGF